MPKQNRTKKTAGSLYGLNILLTRQECHNQELRNSIEALQGHAVSMPLLAIESLLTPALIQHIQSKLLQCKLCVCISKNAAELILPQVEKPEVCTWATIGPATAAYLKQHGCKKILNPEAAPFNSEALLDTLQKHNLKLANQYIMILTGSGGDNYLRNALSKLDAMVELIPIYNRVMPKDAYSHFINIFKTATAIDIILITCVTSLTNLVCLARVAQQEVCKLPLLVVSQRIYEYAKAQGFETVYVAQSMTNESILLALENYRCLNAKKRKA